MNHTVVELLGILLISEAHWNWPTLSGDSQHHLFELFPSDLGRQRKCYLNEECGSWHLWLPAWRICGSKAFDKLKTKTLHEVKVSGCESLCNLGVDMFVCSNGLHEVENIITEMTARFSVHEIRYQKGYQPSGYSVFEMCTLAMQSKKSNSYISGKSSPYVARQQEFSRQANNADF